MNWKMMIWKMIRGPAVKIVCRPPKAYEQVWNGITDKFETCPYDSALDHWVVVPLKDSAWMVRLSIWAHSHNAAAQREFVGADGCGLTQTKQGE